MESVEELDYEFDVEDLEPHVYGKSSVEKLEDKFEVEGFKPFGYDEATWVGWAKEEMERQRRKKEEREKKEAENERRAKAHKEVRDTILEYDPKDEMLVLNGPGRGLVLVDFIYLEIDLKIKEHGVHPDRQFSKRLISIDGQVLSRENDLVVASDTLDSWLSSVEVRFATVLNSVEGTFEIKLLEGHYHGTITVGISGINQRIVIHDSEADGVVTCDESGAITLRRRVMTLCLLGRNLVFHIDNNAGGVLGEQTIDFTPSRTGADQGETSCGAGKFHVRVDWSLMDFRP
ncbi:hypothetical protein ACQ4PT_066812 [Festuca glaucescens]